ARRYVLLRGGAGGTSLRPPCPPRSRYPRGGQLSCHALLVPKGAHISRFRRSFFGFQLHGSGCIPYKVKTMPCDPDQAVEVLVISSSKKRQEIMFPKIRGTSLTRTAFHGSQDSLGRWRYKSKSHDKIHEAVMFPLNVTEELYYWPEKALRTRKWVSRRRPNWLRLCFHWKIEVPSFCLLCRRLVKQISVAEAMAECKHSWMKEALARLVTRLSSEDLVGNDPVTAPTPNSSVVYIKRNEAIVGVQTTSGDLKSDVPPYVRAERFRKSVQICVFPLP
ncbi:hypothetical protein BHM03_00051019, partial [Ensete ventricosum]